MSDGRMLIHEAGVRWKFNPAQPRQHGKWSGPSDLPAQIQAAAHAAYEKAHPELPHKPWVSPPSPQGQHGGKAGGYTAVGITNTELGDKVEDALQRHLGMQNEHPGKRQGPLDLRFDGHGYEVKAVSSMADEYKAKPKASEVASKKAYAAAHGLQPHTMIVVYHPEEKQLYAYSKPGIGAYRLTTEANGWKFHGTIPLDLGDTSPEPLAGDLAELRLGPQEQTTLDTVVREHLKLRPRDTAAEVKRRMKDLGYKVEGEPGGYTYHHILEATKRLKAQVAPPPPTPPPTPPAPTPHLEPPVAPKGPDVDASAEEEQAYQTARQQGLGYHAAMSKKDFLVGSGGDTNTARAAGLLRYINERTAEHLEAVQGRQAALTPPAEGWKHLKPDELKAYYLGAFPQFPSLNDRQRAIDKARNTKVSLYQDKSKITYKMLVSPSHAEALRRQVEKARRLYGHQEPLDVTVGTPAIGKRFPNRVLGQTYTGTGKIYLAPALFQKSADSSVGVSALLGHFMPGYKGKTAIEGVFSHELGHTLDSEKGFGKSATTKGITHGVLYDPNMSQYGKKNGAEAYAEAFAEWHMSNGMTTNPIAQQLAHTEGWAPAGKRAEPIARARAISSKELAALSVPS